MTSPDKRANVFFDIDNTLYSASSKISQAMGQRIHDYFVSMGLGHDEASKLHHQYYSQYGLALRGLTRHHDVDPLDFDKRCDQSLPLEAMIKANPAHRKLFQDIDRTKYRVWGLTNAYLPHAQRVLRILNLDDQIDGGIIYCDYADPDMFCKPEPEYYHKALRKAGNPDPSTCYFVDDSRGNVEAAVKLGWGHCVHFRELGLQVVEGGQVKTIMDEGPIDEKGGIVSITNLEQLRSVWSDIFVQ